VDGRWAQPENLGAPVNTAGREYDPFVAPDESYLIFASERPGGLGGADLYISVRRPDGSWGTPANLGPTVNSAASDYTPMLSPDGQYLFFTSGSAGSDDIYWIEAGVIRAAVKAARTP
jgi:Tol biopolymer transport system component